MEAGLKERLSQLLREHFDKRTENRLIFHFCGHYGTGKKLVAEALCHDVRLPLIIVNTHNFLHTATNIEHAVKLLFREARLQPAAIYLEHFDQLLTNEPKDIHYQNTIFRAIAECSLVTFLAGEKSWSPPASVNKQTCITMEFPIPAYPLRKQLWQQLLNGQYFDSPDNAVDISLGTPISLLAERAGWKPAFPGSESNTDVLANKFRLTGGQIQDAIAAARNVSMMHRSEDNGKITINDLYQSCRAQSNQKLSELAQKISPHYTWTDIVLPADQFQQLREICHYVKYRQVVYDEWGFDRKLSLGKGLNILFCGTSGTGKTMAAEILANELGLDLYKIDLSSVVSKYIGETEKNLAKIFEEAETSNAILFFDEADALFGKRSEVKDAHDRYANIEIGYLLQKMEEYTDVVILATNLQNNMDEAFVRRMHFSVEFLFPEENYRLRIWQNIFPKETPLDTTVDFEFLSRKFKVTGGNIKNIALAATFYAAGDGNAVTMAHLIIATKREYQKMGKLCVKADFGEYYEFVQN